MPQIATLAETGAESPALTIRGLRRPGLEPAALRVEAGECVAVSGPSGAGKSLLLRSIADLDPNEGEVRLGSAARDAIPAPLWRRQVIYVAAESGWWAPDVGAHFEDPEAAAGILGDLALPGEALRWPVSRLSTGERQRLALARALALTPRVLLLDEPTSGLDRESASLVESLLSRALARGAAILLVTHDREQAGRLASRHLQMIEGRLTSDEPALGGEPAAETGAGGTE